MTRIAHAVPRTAQGEPRTAHRLGLAWLLFCAALAIHVTDEALTGFLAVYNPTVLALRERFGFWPMPSFQFREWIVGLTLLVALLLLMSPLVFRNARSVRPILYACAAVIGIANATGHTIATLLGQTVSTVRFPRPAPGFYSSPLLLLSACVLLVQLRRSKEQAAAPSS
jgi:hypothetical protein